MEFLQLAQERYSCRKFSDKPVEQEKLDKIIAAAIAAPTAVNFQPVKVWTMDSPRGLELVQQVTRYTFGAKHFMVVGGKTADAWTRGQDNYNFAGVDAAIVATHIMMEARDLGLDTTWVGSFDAPLLKKLCPEMADYELVVLFPIGYAEDSKAGGPGPLHGVRKSRAEMVTDL